MRALALGMLIACEGSGPREPVAPEPTPVERAAEPATLERAAEATQEAVENVPPARAEPAVLEPPDDLRFPALEGEPSFSHEQILEEIATARSQQFKPVGTTNIVFRLQLDSEHLAAFKPSSEQRERGYRAEIAAYRLSRLLGMDNVAPAIFRTATAREIRTRLHRRYEEAWLEIEEWTRWEAAGTTRGAAIYWIPQLADPGLDQPDAVREWTSWLSQQGDAPAEHRALARDLSCLMVFDYLIANWDRFSGGNLSALPDRSRLVVRDHDASFGVPLTIGIHDRLRRGLRRAERFSRALVDRLVRLDEEALRREFARDPSARDEELLTPPQIADLLERREVTLSYIGALVDRYGRDAVLAFP